MTRFARAKGSKSSNLKAPDDSTPWEVMKEQLLQAKKDSVEHKNKELAEKQRIENYNNFLNERKVQKRKSTWCDFPEVENNKKEKQSENNKPNKIKKKSKTISTDEPIASSHETNVYEALNSSIVNDVSKKRKKNETKNVSIEVKQNTDKINVKKEEVENMQQHIKNKKKKHETKMDITLEQNIESISANKEKDKNKKKNKKITNLEMVSVSTNNHAIKQIISTQNKNSKNIRGHKPTRRKEINDRSFQLIINGKEIELIRFDGFPIMKKDAERLNELKTSMMKKGIPKTEVNRTIKLERRRAEKALARLKRDVCYNCRKGGHNLSDCPELKSNIPGVGAAEGICFKCGSTEHRQFECKVQRDKEFRFASCFICKEQGHIARQCPDNPKGLYPNGGCCKLCGDVTHLRKDCPTVQNKKDETSIKLQTLETGSNIEDIELQSKLVADEPLKKPKKIRF